MPTAEERAAAIKASQEHWRKNLAVELPWPVNLGLTGCALCRLYHPDVVGRLRRICIGCPIKERTGHSLCRRTPYPRALRAFEAWSADPANPELKAKFRAAVDCHRHQAANDFEEWALAAERLTTCGVAAEAACLSAEVDFPFTRMDREARHD